MFQNISIEKVRVYWDRHPCNIKESLSKVGTRRYFDEIEAHKYFTEPYIPKFAEFERWQGKKVLEIGCGIGTDTINFARNGAEVTAVDISQKSLDLAKQRAKVYGLEDKIKFYCVNAEELSKVVPIESYDLIYSYGVIHHTSHPERVIEEIKNYLHPEGVFKIMVYHRHSWNVLRILISKAKLRFWQLDKFIAQHSESCIGCPITYTFTKKKVVEDLLKDFNIIEISPKNLPKNLAGFVSIKYKKYFKSLSLPDFIHKFFEKHIGWNLCITAVPREQILKRKNQ